MTSLENARKRCLKRLVPTSLSTLGGYRRLAVFLKERVDEIRRSGMPFSPTAFVGDRVSDCADVASAVAGELAESSKSDIHRIEGARLQSSEQVVAVVTRIDDGDVLLVSEIEAMAPSACDQLISATVNQAFPVQVTGGTRYGDIVDIELTPYHLLATSTRVPGDGDDRRWSIVEVRRRTVAELTRIAHWCAGQLSVSLTEPAATELASRSHGHSRRLRELIVEVFLENSEPVARDTSATIDAAMVRRVLDGT